MKKIITISISFMLLILLSFIAYIPQSSAREAALTEQTPAQETYNPDDDIIVKVNDYGISYTNHQIATNQLKNRVSYHKHVSERRQKELSDTALNGLIMDQLFYEEAKRNSVTVSKRDVKLEIRHFQNNLPNGMTLGKVLKQSNMSRDDLTNEFRRGMIIKKTREAADDEIMAQARKLITKKYMKKYYKKNLDKFKEPDKIHISEILLKADPGGGKEHWLQVLEKITKIKARITEGEEFAEVAKEVSQDDYAPNGGDIGWAHSGTLTAGIEEATTGLKPGEVSEPVETLYGYHLVKLHERISSKLKTFNELNFEMLKDELSKSEFQRIRSELYDTLLKKATIVYFDDN